MKKIVFITITSMLLFVLIACQAEETNKSRTSWTDKTLLTLDYENKKFTEDGIGVVTLTRCIDGDTARFSEDGGITDFSVRFLGIDTPEVGRNSEPWGQAASEFTCNRLSNAFTIVLERNFEGPLFGNYGRFLAFVWYDGRLLNLELIEESFSDATGVLSLRYGDAMQNAWYEARTRGERIHGETDPTFNYGN